MRARCYSVTNPDFREYGGRGITVCEEWLNSFEAFYIDMGEAPIGHTLGRKDNNGPYCKENCEWQTMKKQCSNRRSNYNITFRGETKTISEWSRITGVLVVTIKARIERHGWSVERALTEPINK